MIMIHEQDAHDAACTWHCAVSTPAPSYWHIHVAQPLCTQWRLRLRARPAMGGLGFTAGGRARAHDQRARAGHGAGVPTSGGFRAGGCAARAEGLRGWAGAPGR